MNFECSIKQELYKYLLLYCESIDNLYIAFSGGVDSCVLLDALFKINNELNLNKKIIAIHINHNISKNSAKWESFCHKFCEDRNIKINSHQVNLEIKKDETLESVARLARYNIFKSYVKDNKSILITAHHQNDQAETVLLNLFRGSGIEGLTGMQVLASLDNSINTKLLRPLLNITKKTVLEYAKNNNLNWVDDESNSRVDYSRNFLRHEIIPKLQEKWPAVISKIAHSAEHSEDAKNYIDKNIESHYQESLSVDKFGYKVLDIDYLRNLNNIEQKYLVRYFIKQQSAAYPSKIKLDEILNQVLTARPDADISVCWKKDNNKYEIKRFKHKIYLLKNFQHTHNKVYQKYIFKIDDEIYIKEIDKTIKLSFKDLDGVDIVRNQKLIEINFRKNLNANEVIVDIGNKQKYTLKKYLQKAGVPNWLKNDIVLIIIDGKIKKLLYYNFAL